MKNLMQSIQELWEEYWGLIIIAICMVFLLVMIIVAITVPSEENKVIEDLKQRVEVLEKSCYNNSHEA